MLKMCSSKIFATATKVTQATIKSAQMLGGAATVTAVSVLVSASDASALDFNFSFYGNGSYSGHIGWVRGKLTGLTEGATGVGGVEITENPISSSFNGVINPFIINSNSLTVSGGNLTGGIYLENETETILLWLNSPDGTGSFLAARDGTGDGNTYWEEELGPNEGGSGTTFTLATAAEVPFDFDPAFGAALGLPLFIGLRYLKKRVASKKLKFNSTGTVS